MDYSIDNVVNLFSGYWSKLGFEIRSNVTRLSVSGFPYLFPSPPQILSMKSVNQSRVKPVLIQANIGVNMQYIN